MSPIRLEGINPSQPSLLEHDREIVQDESPVHIPLRLWPEKQHLTRSSFRDRLENLTTVVVGGGDSSGQRDATTSNAAVTYTLHTNLLVAVSPFFAAALQSLPADNETKSPGKRTVSLVDERPEIFEWFIWWMYTGSLTTPSDAAGASSACPDPPMTRYEALMQRKPCRRAVTKTNLVGSTTSPPHSDGDLRNKAGMPKYFLLLDLYALSDVLMTSTLTNHILDTIARMSEETNSVLTPSDTWILYDTFFPEVDDSSNVPASSVAAPRPSPSSIQRSLPPASPAATCLKRLVIDLFTYKKTDRLIDTHPDPWHPRFLRDLILRLKRDEPDYLGRLAVADRVCFERFGPLLSASSSLSPEGVMRGYVSGANATMDNGDGRTSNANQEVASEGVPLWHCDGLCGNTIPPRLQGSYMRSDARHLSRQRRQEEIQEMQQEQQGGGGAGILTTIETKVGRVPLTSGMGVRCQGCGLQWCAECVALNRLGSMLRPGRNCQSVPSAAGTAAGASCGTGLSSSTGSCKPWLVGKTAKGFCGRYHLH